MMEDQSTVTISQRNSVVRILYDSKRLRNRVLPWHGDEPNEGWLTLREISNHLIKKGMSDVIHVWIDSPMEGRIYQFNNYGENEWIEYGRTIGWANQGTNIDDPSEVCLFEDMGIHYVFCGDQMFSIGFPTRDEGIPLSNIGTSLKRMGYTDEIYVWRDTPLNGEIYRWSHETKSWTEYGSTMGFA